MSESIGENTEAAPAKRPRRTAAVRRAEREAKDKRDRDAFNLHVQGYTLLQIGQQLGWANPSGVHKAIERFLTKDIEASEEQRALELVRLDALWRTWFPRAAGLAYTEGQQVVAAGAPDLDAAKYTLQLHDRRAKLLGLTREAIEEVDLDELRREAEANGLDGDEAVADFSAYLQNKTAPRRRRRAM